MVFNNDIETIAFAIQNPKNRDIILMEREKSKAHQKHVSGNFIDEYMKKQAGFETDNEFSIRKENEKGITVPIMASVMKPFNKIFSARGGSVNLKFKTKDNKKNTILENEFNSKASRVAKGSNLRNWMQNIWLTQVNIDPFGLAVLSNQNSEELKLVIKSSFDIYDICYNSFTEIEYIIFEPYIIKINNIVYECYRVIDADNDYTVLLKYGARKEDLTNWTIAPFDENSEIRSYENIFTLDTEKTVVPAIFLSQRHDKKNMYATDTWISEAIPFADDYLVDYTNNRIYKLKQGFPYVWQYTIPCKECEGEGTSVDGEYCEKCQGTGLMKTRSISEAIALNVPEEGQPQLTPPAGYVQPDLNTWTKQEETLDRIELAIENSIWGSGTSVDKTRKDTTAFEISIRKETQLSFLDSISSNAETIETFILTLVGNYYYPEVFESINIQYGRRYDIKSTTELWDEYLSAKKDNVDIQLLDTLINEYYYSMYKRDPREYQYKVKITRVKPFFHYSTDALLSIKEHIDIVDFLGNLYFNDFAEFEGVNMRLKTTEQLKEDLKNYIRTNYSDLIINNNNTETNE